MSSISPTSDGGADGFDKMKIGVEDSMKTAVIYTLPDGGADGFDKMKIGVEDSMKTAVIYTLPHCPWCKKAIDKAGRYAVPYRLH